MKCLAVPILLALASLVAGCSPGTFTGGTTTVTTTIVASAAPYHAYGDSITAGYALPDPFLQAYPVLVAQAESLTLTDLAISGDQACDIPTRQIFPHADSPSTALKTVYTVLISTNDVDVKGSGAYEAVFNLCDQATLAWLGTPSQSKVLAAAAVVSGASHTDTGNSFNGVATDAVGASLTFTLQRANTGAVYVWYRVTDGSTGSFSYTVDGVKLGSVSSSTSPAIATSNGSYTSLGLLRIPAVAGGAHTLVLTQTGGAASGLSVVAVGVPSATLLSGSPRVLAGTTPMQYNGSGSPCNYVSAPNCLAYIADITANVALLASDGLDVELFDSRKYMTGSAADMTDYVHPNPLGQQEIAHAITDAY